jgi:drug/metabolite transporter (DMT)-like permease
MDDLHIALIGGLLGMLGYGISDFLAKTTIDKIGDLRTLFYSQMIGALLISLFLIEDPRLPVISAETIIQLSVLGVTFTIGYLSLYRAFELGQVSIVTPITSSFTIVSALVSYFVFGETFSTLKAVSLVFVISGIILTANNLKDLRAGTELVELLKGVPQAVTAFLIFGFLFPFWDKFIEGPGWAIWVILLRVVLALSLIAYAVFTKKQITGIKGKSIFRLLFFVALFEAIAFFGNSWALNASENTVSIVVAISSTFSLVTVTLAYLFLKEKLVRNQYAGIALILLGLALMPFV